MPSSPADDIWHTLSGQYDRVAGADPSLLALRDAVVAELPASTRRVLDLGTGTGDLLAAVRGRFPECELVGLDPAPGMVEQARAKFAADPRAGFVAGSADRLDFPDGSFDAVVSSFALHHLTHPGKWACAREVYRVLAPGGRFAFGDQHIARMGGPDDLEWVDEVFVHFAAKARHYLRTAGLAKMLLQVRLLPEYLTAGDEKPATVEYWLDGLRAAGFANVRVVTMTPEFLRHAVIVGDKPSA